MLLKANKAFVFLSATYIFLSPLHHTIKDKFGLSLHAPLVLLMLLLALICLVQGSYAELLDVLKRNRGNWLVIGFALMLAFKGPNLATWIDLVGAIFFPFAAGTLLAVIYKGAPNFDDLLLYITGTKLLIISFLIPELVTAYPVRPQFWGRAIYLLFGFGLDVAPFILIYFFEKKIKTNFISYLMAGLAVSFTGFLIVGINSRALTLLSLAVTPLLSFFLLKERGARVIGIFLYPTAVVISFFAVPERFEHFSHLMYSFIGLGESTDLRVGLQHIDDKSISVRVGEILSGLLMNERPIFGNDLDISAPFLKGSHFWIVQIYYYVGLIGLSVFVCMNFVFVQKIYSVVKSALQSLNSQVSVMIFAALFSISFFLHIFYAASIVNDPVYYFFIGLLINLNLDQDTFIRPTKEHRKWPYALKLTSR